MVEAELKETGTRRAVPSSASHGRVVFAKGFGVTRRRGGRRRRHARHLFRLAPRRDVHGGGAGHALRQGRIKLDEAIAVRQGLPPKLSQVTAHHSEQQRGVATCSAAALARDAALGAMGAREDDVMFGEPAKSTHIRGPGFWLAGYVLEDRGKPTRT